MFSKNWDKTLAKHTSRLDLAPRNRIKRFFMEEMSGADAKDMIEIMDALKRFTAPLSNSSELNAFFIALQLRLAVRSIMSVHLLLRPGDTKWQMATVNGNFEHIPQLQLRFHRYSNPKGPRIEYVPLGDNGVPLREVPSDLTGPGWIREEA